MNYADCMNMCARGFCFFQRRNITIITAFLLTVLITYGANAQSPIAENTTQPSVISSLTKTIVNIIQDPFPVGNVEEPTKKVLADITLYGIMADITSPTAPFSYGEYAIFIHYDKSEDARVSIAFAKENYAHTHHFVRLTSNPRILVYALPKQETATTHYYRLVINGVWTHDYQNPNSIIDDNSVHVSVAAISALPRVFFPSFVYNRHTKHVRFFLYLNKKEYQMLTDTSLRPINPYIIEYNHIYIVGNFTAWDPFLIRMHESPDQENLYYADVTLDKGTYYYYFQVGNYDILDPKNRNIVPRFTENLYANTLFINKTRDTNTGAAYLVAKKSSKN